VNPFRWIDLAVNHPGWKGIACRVPLCSAMVAAILVFFVNSLPFIVRASTSMFGIVLCMG